MNYLHQFDHILDRSVGQNPVAQIEDVPGPCAGLIQDSFHPLPDIGQARIEHGGIQIPLYSHLIAQTCPGLVQLDVRVQPDNISSGVSHVLKQHRGDQPASSLPPQPR